ncbi:MAG: peptidase P60 [Alphaproteobacteria bacterium]|nr:peptidase P60 [Alphaproteobacteria bacterium]
MKGDPRLTPARDDLAADYLRAIVKAGRYAKGEPRQVRLPYAPLHARPDVASGRLTEALMGEIAIVYEDAAGWSWCQLAADGYVGYMPSVALGEPGPEPSHKVGALRTFIYAEPNLKSKVLGAVSLGSMVAAEGSEDVFTAIDGGGWVFSEHLRPVDEMEPDYLTTAIRFVGVPYLWGGKTSLGLDCSGLVQVALRFAGILDCPRDSDMQAAELGEAIEPDARLAQRGDLVFFPGHVGMVIDDGVLLHANAWDMMVSPHPLRYVVAEVAKKHPSPVTAIRRLA